MGRWIAAEFRRERLSWMLTHPASVDLETIAHMRQGALDLDAQFAFGGTPSSTLIHAASQQLAQVTLLRKHAPSNSIREQLCALSRARISSTARAPAMPLPITASLRTAVTPPPCRCR